MTVKCPHCGLEGKAEEEILNRKIRCPKCREIFIAVEAAAQPVTTASAPPENDQQDVVHETAVEQDGAAAVDDVPETEAEEEPACSTELGETIEDDDIALLGDESEDREEALPAGVFRCICCGFVFSEQYRQDTEQGPYCVACNKLTASEPVAA